MKTIIFFLSLCTIAIQCYSQDEKFSVNLTTGFGIFGGSTNETINQDTTTVDAACAIFGLSGEYTFAEKFSVGILVERNGFLTNSDSSEKANSLNLYTIQKYRFVDNENNKIYVSLAEGYSYLSFSNGNGSDNINGTGFSLQAGAGWEHYFTTNFGMSLSAWYAWYQYSNLVDNNNNNVMVNNSSENLVLTMSGANVKAGLVFKF